MPNALGTLDYGPEQWSTIKQILDTIRKEASTMDLEEIDTPAIESTSTLLEKYGQEAESKEIFRLKDDKFALRYDLTVPLQRYMLDNGLENIRRFQIGKVFREDEPRPESGRYREFYQADVDLVGEYSDLTPEIEIFFMINQVLTKLGISDYNIRYNYRPNLFAMCQKIGVADDKKKRLICTSIDKLDKQEWEVVQKELTDTRGLTSDQTQELKGLLDSNYLDYSLQDTDNTLRDNCQNLQFDATLSRGLDYYTGIIYEVVIPNDSKIKTVIAGGRYDKLIYKNQKNGKKYIPAIGLSFGVSRLALFVKPTPPSVKKVLVISQDIGIRSTLIRFYRSCGYDTSYFPMPIKIIRQITHAVRNGFYMVAIYGEDGDQIKVKQLWNQDTDKTYPLDTFTVSTA